MNGGTIQIGVVSAALAEDVRQGPRVARELGFSGVQFDAYGSVNIPELSGSGRREFRHVAAAQEQQIVGLRVDIGGKGFAPGADVDRALDRVERAMEAAAGIGSPLVCVEVGPMPSPVSNMPKPKVTPQQAGLIIIPGADIVPAGTTTQEETSGRPFDAAAASQVDAAMSELGRRADRYSVVVAFRSELGTLPALERALSAARCPWFGVDFDPTAMHREGWSVDEFFSRLGTLVRHVRGRDALAGSDRRTKPAAIGKGSTDWEEVFAALDQVGYGGWVTVDPYELSNRSAGAVEGLEHLKPLAR